MLKLFSSGRNLLSVAKYSRIQKSLIWNCAVKNVKFSSVFKISTSETQGRAVDLDPKLIRPGFQRHLSTENYESEESEENENIHSKDRAEKYPLSVTERIEKDYLSIDEVMEILKENFCEDPCVIKVDSNRIKFHYVDYFVVVSGRSVRHLKSMAFGLCSKFKKRVREQRGKATAVVEGEDCLDWMAVDIGNIVVHFMMPEAREKYELEKLWTLGPELDEQYQAMLKEQEDPPVYQFKLKEHESKNKPDGPNLS